ncbi:tRNA pseudouridine(38-40) synthase [Anncaliia algerae PRA109]|nr:tRNA pseudouridine(38-40) synthase [Anncaliia algerae PRA109]
MSLEEDFDSTKFVTKNIALRFSYDGSKYQGLASQKTNNTIDYQLKQALLKCKLADPEVKITYAGRTDAGVSASNMVASLEIYALKGERIFNYDTMLNSKLPMEIRITGYSFVEKDFSARFSCKKRSYKYFFLKNNLNIQKMIEASEYFLQQKNFKYFCKGHKEKEEKYFIRPIQSIKFIEKDICEMEITSISFLHNMVRKVFFVLELVGKGDVQINELYLYFNGIRPVGTAKPEFLLFINAEYDNITFINNLKSNDNYYLLSHVKKNVYENIFEIEREKN